MMFSEFTYEQFVEKIKSFHGTVAPGIILGGVMINYAKELLPKEGFYDVICETRTCLPDAVQLLTPCSVGNGWLRILDFGKFACIFYDKYTGQGIRIFLDLAKLEAWPEIKSWFLKLKPKHEQDKELLLKQMQEAGYSIYGKQEVIVNKSFLKKKKLGKNAICPICHEAYPAAHGSVCKGCTEDLPYNYVGQIGEGKDYSLLNKTPVEKSVGMHLLHDITRVIHNKEKGPAFKRGHLIIEDDIRTLKNIGKNNLYLEECNTFISGFVHEDDAACAIAESMKGAGVDFVKAPKEGKIDIVSQIDGILVFDEERLFKFNNSFGVICAALPNYSLVKKGDVIAGTRIIPLFISKENLLKALNAIAQKPLFEVKEFKKAKVGILSTGTEVFEGTIKDEYTDIIKKKLEKFNCEIIATEIAPDITTNVSENITRMVEKGADLIITTAGLSVDPDDITREAIIEAGAVDVIYSAPILPGSMILLAKVGSTQIIGLPACGLFDKYFSFDLVLPRVLAQIDITKDDIAKMGNGGLLYGKI